MNAEEVKHILAAAGIDFVSGDSTRREVYLYPEDLVADGVRRVAPGWAVKVTFTYERVPAVRKEEIWETHTKV